MKQLDNEKISQNKMGTMPVGKLITSMSLPAMFSMIINALYNIIDSIFVGMIGEHALAAVTLVLISSIMLLRIPTLNCPRIFILVTYSTKEVPFLFLKKIFFIL